MRQAWLLLASLTLTCASPRPIAPAHAQARPRAQPAQSSSASLASPPLSPPIAAAPRSAPGPLATFFAALTELRQGARQRHVRVFWLGDSHTNADFLSGAVRDAFTQAFGDGGPGFVRIGTRAYRHAGVKVARGGKWNVDPDPPARRSLQDDGVFGLGGTRAVPAADASYSLQIKTPHEGVEAPARFELAYALPRGGSFEVELGAKKLRVDGKATPDVAASGVAHLSLLAPLSTPFLLAGGRGEPQLFSVIVERVGSPGFVLDTVGIDGARLETPLAWNEAAFVAELARRAPELCVLAFGTNEVFDALRVDRYARHLTDLVGRLRRAAPSASCLVLGPTDAPLGEGSVPRVAEVAEVLARAARGLGCSFASLQRLMGGEGSFARGMKAKERLAQPDRLHLTPKGYQELGGALARELLEAYSAGRGDLP